MDNVLAEIDSHEHPEREAHELFVTNSTIQGLVCFGWRTKRRGDIAYDTRGTVIPEMVPVFCDLCEVELKDPRITENLLPHHTKRERGGDPILVWMFTPPHKRGVQTEVIVCTVAAHLRTIQTVQWGAITGGITQIGTGLSVWYAHAGPEDWRVEGDIFAATRTALLEVLGEKSHKIEVHRHWSLSRCHPLRSVPRLR